ncbi:DUF456 domain-containing protein [Chlorobium phaeobacteroides]|jgi:hypothetical protein|uniref:DUF456 domain-containing protein n=1 Tax=Chlorobium phaeobacteroides (strain DSM 266 / SMG 266 / 2430) TaxID=290317 RepID=A1BH72_CHLPD|nr:DUF456 family protein [Chlorobium phaeobacteroides]ABL65749.1 protein of unknown function DUF456 [Chlorobium phaeobacteroides DSM 266]
MDQSMLLWILAGALIVAGFAGLVIPALPGIVLVFAGLIIAAWAENFVFVGPVTIAVLSVLTIVAYLADFAAGALGAKKFSAGGYAAGGAAIGALGGMLFGIPGIIIGPFLGAVAGELMVRRDLRAAGLAGLGTWIGLAVGAAVKVAIAFAMLGIFLLVRFL